MSDTDVFLPAVPTERALDLAPDQAEFVLQTCVDALKALDLYLANDDIEGLVNTKQIADVLHRLAVQRDLGREAELSAAEIVRRAERDIAIAVQRGQDTGTILRHGETATRRNQHGDPALRPQRTKSSPDEFFVSNHERSDAYVMRDLATDQVFNEVLDEAKTEGNLSRANVLRKVRGESPKRDRPDVLRNRRHIDPNRVVEQTVLHSGMSESVAELLDYSALDRDRLEGWVSSLTEVIRSLTTLKRNLMKELTRDEG